MRFLHTADWHLGRVLHGVSLLEDQAYVLEQILAIARDERPDFLLIAGDVYDRTVPPAEAVDLLSTTLERLALDLRLPTFLIAGNHDCPRRLGFGARLLGQSGIRLAGAFTPACCDEPIPFRSDAGEELDLFLLPYAEPAVSRQSLADDEIRCHDSAMRAATARMARTRQSGRRRLLVGHAYVDGGDPTDSERPLSVGGAGTVSPAHFAGFDYVALGHLHRPQLAGDVARYAGSILKYSFSEAHDKKSITLVDLPAHGGPAECRQIPLAPRRELSLLTGTFQELCERGAAGCPECDHFLSVELTDEVMVLDPKGRLEKFFPHILHLDRRALRSAAAANSGDGSAGRDLRRVGPGDVFDAFFRDVKGTALTGEQSAAFAELFAALPADQREPVA